MNDIDDDNNDDENDSKQFRRPPQPSGNINTNFHRGGGPHINTSTHRSPPTVIPVPRRKEYAKRTWPQPKPVPQGKGKGNNTNHQ
jgi:hypothetical protein